jgi:4-hydroxy-tetrahydrodipicolinate reductase
MEATYPSGICVGTRIIGEIDTEEGVTARAEIELRLFQDGEVEHMFWEVDGKPKTRVRVERDDSAHATAANLFNRIPDVLAARAGVVTVSELGPLKTTALVRATM